MDYNITYRQKDGGWQYIISYKDNDKWRQKSKQGFDSKKTAKKAADDRLELLKKDITFVEECDQEYKGITFGEFSNVFIEHEKLYKESNTIVIYDSAIKKFSALNKLAMTEITYKDVQKCIDKMVEQGYTTSTIKLYVSKIKIIFRNAIKPYNIISTSPIQDIRIPVDKDKSTKIKALTKKEVKTLLDAIKTSNTKYSYMFYMITLVGITSGCRIGEILGLTWSDVDFQNGIITVSRQWKKLKDNTYGLGTLKSKNSYRTVPLPSNTLKELKAYKATGLIDFQNNRIFPRKSTAVTADVLIKLYKGLGYSISVHDLRHTYVSTLIGNGVDFKTVAQLLGHTVEMTMKTYSHFTDDMMEKAKIAIQNIF